MYAPMTLHEPTVARNHQAGLRKIHDTFIYDQTCGATDSKLLSSCCYLTYIYIVKWYMYYLSTCDATIFGINRHIYAFLLEQHLLVEVKGGSRPIPMFMYGLDNRSKNTGIFACILSLIKDVEV